MYYDEESGAVNFLAGLLMGAVLGALFGRKTFSYVNVSRAGRAMQSVGRTFEQRQDVTHAEDNIDALKRQLADLNPQRRLIRTTSAGWRRTRHRSPCCVPAVR